MGVAVVKEAVLSAINDVTADLVDAAQQTAGGVEAGGARGKIEVGPIPNSRPRRMRVEGLSTRPKTLRDGRLENGSAGEG